MSALRQARQARNQTQEELADLLGVHRTLVQHWESGRRRPSLERLKKLQALYPDATLDWQICSQETVRATAA